MRYLAIALLVLAGCEDGEINPALKKECEAVLQHIVTITPEGKGDDPAKVVAALPIEDFQACGAMEPEVRGCMLVAADVAAVKKCIPPDDILGCLQTTTKAAKAAREKANGKDKADQPDPKIDAQFAPIRAKCWAGDAKAADSLKPKE